MIKSNKCTLDNGLRIVHHSAEHTEMVAMDLIYNVGSKDESPNHTGFAHLFEHLMFGGSAHIPSYDAPCEMAGGENNAWTSEDVTNFYITLPACNIETGFWLESDRMNALSFNEESLRIQKQVVMEEFSERSNAPYGDSSRLLRQMAYKKHPYQWLTIGKCLDHIAQTKMADVKDFFYHHYAPNNAVLTVAGAISFDETVRLAKKWFGKIPSRPISERHYPQEPPQTALRMETVERDVPSDALYMAFHTCPRTDRLYWVFDLITDLLANGSSSRLPRRLIREKQRFDSIDAYITDHFDSGLLVITGRLAKGVSFEEARQSVWEELACLTTDVSDYELEKVKNKFESQWIFSNMSNLSIACNLATAELLGQDINRQVAAYRAVSREDVVSTVQQFLQQENCSILNYKKKRLETPD